MSLRNRVLRIEKNQVKRFLIWWRALSIEERMQRTDEYLDAPGFMNWFSEQPEFTKIETDQEWNEIVLKYKKEIENNECS